ncbi:hypothetical protein KEM56_004536 [Ascosphaera pollenicola]|nr:hypothetical protein KEM56_004536 [Ascosphaera pollenicola]
MDVAATFRPISLDRYVGRWVFLNFCSDDFEPDNGSEGCTGPPDDNDLGENLSKSSESSAPYIDYYQEPFPHIQSRCFEHPLSLYMEIEGSLLDYFIRRVSAQCSLASAHNPYLHYVTPLCFHYEPVRNAILAASANQLCILGDSRFRKEAFIYKQKTLTGLRETIAAGNLNDGTLATILMLCFRDISEGCTPSWTTHLRGGLQLMEALKSGAKHSCAARFFMMYFVAHEIMGRTASDKWAENETASLWHEDDDLEEVGMTMGCSRGLMTQIDRISFLAKKKFTIMKKRSLTPDEKDYIFKEVIGIKASLLNLDQRLPAHSAGREDLMRIAETKRLATLLYLHERFVTLDSSEVDDPAATPDRSPPQTMRAVPASSKRHIVQSLINLISTLPDMATLLWPLYILGNADIDDEEHRRFVLDRLENIEKTRNLGSVRLARLAVRNAFRRRDLRHPRGKVWGNETTGLISLA